LHYSSFFPLYKWLYISGIPPRFHEINSSSPIHNTSFASHFCNSQHQIPLASAIMVRRPLKDRDMIEMIMAKEPEDVSHRTTREIKTQIRNMVERNSTGEFAGSYMATGLRSLCILRAETLARRARRLQTVTAAPSASYSLKAARSTLAVPDKTYSSAEIVEFLKAHTPEEISNPHLKSLLINTLQTIPPLRPGEEVENSALKALMTRMEMIEPDLVGENPEVFSFDNPPRVINLCYRVVSVLPPAGPYNSLGARLSTDGLAVDLVGSFPGSIEWLEARLRWWREETERISHPICVVRGTPNSFAVGQGKDKGKAVPKDAEKRDQAPLRRSKRLQEQRER
jgi:hypothetical protein